MEYKDIYEQIIEYCKVRTMSARHNGMTNTPPRVRYIIEMMNHLQIPHEHEKWHENTNTFHNIYAKGASQILFTAHHDITGNSAGANDNSASVINLIALKKLLPNTNIALIDGEEIGGKGSKHLAETFKTEFPHVKHIVNLELTGLGGKYFFIGKTEKPQKITEIIQSTPQFKGLRPVPEIDVPFNDSVVFREYGIDSVVINALPPLVNDEYIYYYPRGDIQFCDGTKLDMSIIGLCNGKLDTIDTISTKDMKEFVEMVLLPITLNYEINFKL